MGSRSLEIERNFNAGIWIICFAKSLANTNFRQETLVLQSVESHSSTDENPVHLAASLTAGEITFTYWWKFAYELELLNYAYLTPLFWIGTVNRKGSYGSPLKIADRWTAFHQKFNEISTGILTKQNFRIKLLVPQPVKSRSPTGEISSVELNQQTAPHLTLPFPIISQNRSCELGGHVHMAHQSWWPVGGLHFTKNSTRFQRISWPNRTSS